ARGMGAATLRAFVGAGADVIGMDVLDQEGKKVAEVAAAEGPGTASYMHVDVTDMEDVKATFAKAVEKLGGLDVLAHPAAIHRNAPPEHATVEDWDAIFAVNVRGTMITNQVAYPYLRDAGGGAIINFGSISGLRPEPTAPAYSATKGAVHSWTRSAAGAWGADNIRVNAVLPAIATPMYYEAQERASEEQREIGYWRNQQPIALGQKYGDPDRDLGPVMVFLASDASHFITGQLIPVDGGQASTR
ncbi:MAG: SDR family oxidoreductase, partial [Alphaproteobacteria bacterium]|nr:SDR family oxidoreductase [Alphaproteobacteria bacterium]